MIVAEHPAQLGVGGATPAPCVQLVDHEADRAVGQRRDAALRGRGHRAAPDEEVRAPERLDCGVGVGEVLDVRADDRRILAIQAGSLDLRVPLLQSSRGAAHAREHRVLPTRERGQAEHRLSCRRDAAECPTGRSPASHRTSREHGVPRRHRGAPRPRGRRRRSGARSATRAASRRAPRRSRATSPRVDAEMVVVAARRQEERAGYDQTMRSRPSASW